MEVRLTLIHQTQAFVLIADLTIKKKISSNANSLFVSTFNNLE